MVTICKNSNFSKLKKILLQNRENWGMSENVFWSITFFVFDLQTRIVPHFKAKIKINNSFYCIEHLRSKLKPLPLIISVQIIVPHPLHNENGNEMIALFATWKYWSTSHTNGIFSFTPTMYQQLRMYQQKLCISEY